MFAFVRWKIISVDGISVAILVENTGLGLEILGSPNVVNMALQKENLEVFIHHHITDVSQVLFGFLTLEEKNLFKNLIKVNGIGGKTALNMLGLGEEALLTAIQTEDDKLLSSVPGIGKKTAQKIIVDLKGSIDFSTKTSDEKWKVSANNDTPLIASLVAMWYDKSLVEGVIAEIDPALPLAEKTKEAIKKMARW